MPYRRPRHASSKAHLKPICPIRYYYRRPIWDRHAWSTTHRYKQAKMSIFKYVFKFRLVSTDMLASDGFPQACLSQMGHVGSLIAHIGLRSEMSGRSLMMHIEVSYGSPIRHVGLRWVSDNIFVNSLILLKKRTWNGKMPHRQNILRTIRHLQNCWPRFN